MGETSMIIASGSFTAEGQTSTEEGHDLTGRVDVWRGAGEGTVALERRGAANAEWRSTGDALASEGSHILEAGFQGGIRYRLRCVTLAGDAIEWELAA
jgi:hypothetical protein